MILLVVALLVRGTAIVETTAADALVMLTYAIISLALGIAMILGHNVWSGRALPVVVTLVGWSIFAKGLLLLFVAPEQLPRLFEKMHYSGNYYLYLTPSDARLRDRPLSHLGRVHNSDTAQGLSFKRYHYRL